MRSTPPVILAGGAFPLTRTAMGYTTALGHTPTFSISKGGEDITSSIADRVISIRVESLDGGGDADVCDITLDDRGWNIASPSIGEGSATLSIAMGYVKTGLYQMGTFQVDELYYEWIPKQIRLHGNSLGMTTNAKAPLITSFNGKTLGDIIGAIATSAGVSPVISASLSGIAVPYLNQNASSMHMLQELERRYNGLAKFSDGNLRFTERGTGEAASGESIGTFVLSPEDFGPGCSIQTTNRFAHSGVKAAYFDKVANQLQWVQSTVAGNPNSTVPFTIKKPLTSQAEAQAFADSTMAQLNRKCKEGSVTLAKGHPAVRGGQAFTIAGCRDGIDGPYLVRKAVHTFTKDSGIASVIDCYDEGGDAPEGSSDGQLDVTAISASTIPANGIGHN